MSLPSRISIKLEIYIQYRKYTKIIVISFQWMMHREDLRLDSFGETHTLLDQPPNVSTSVKITVERIPKLVRNRRSRRCENLIPSHEK